MKFIKHLFQLVHRVFAASIAKRKIFKKLLDSNPQLFNINIVQDGPFQGLIYPKSIAYGSSFYPKVLGTYEKELHIFINSIKSKNYKTIIDIGCAEGYYAVGLKRMFQDASVYAIDTNNKARGFCKEMAEINDCLNNFEVMASIDIEGLANIVNNETLLICDCEGFEADIFNQKSLYLFHECDLIIETHDFISPSISTNLQELFSQTHNVSIVQSLDDNLKAKYYSIPNINSLSFEERKYLLSENRPQIMEWLICTKN